MDNYVKPYPWITVVRSRFSAHDTVDGFCTFILPLHICSE